MVRGFSWVDRLRLVELVCRGVSLRSAARVVGVSRTSALQWWRDAAVMELQLRGGRGGGLDGGWPGDVVGTGTQRVALSIADRSAIAAGCFHRRSVSAIAASIGRDKSVVSREIRRHRSPDGVYRAAVAHRAAAARRARPKPFKLAQHPRVCRRIEEWMDQGWSPRLISQMLSTGIDGETVRVSHETIYQALYVQTRGSLRKDLARKLALKRTARKPRGGVERRGASAYREAFKISQRPAEVADRAVPGHWEGDLIYGAGTATAVGTLVERSTRFVILLHLPGRHDAASVAAAMIAQMGKLPQHLRRSLTWDRGTEMAGYRHIQLKLDMPVYFCDPHSPWQRGSNENTNRLLRFWLEKGHDLSRYNADDLATIAATLNARPRPTLGLKTPAQALDELLSNPPADNNVASTT
ncbi:IS30 family transposase [Nocardioides sp. Bht2]|uniref:IS30 family transposase n=1 Tax=Nocardioides sp. Bht2 TaxID=3392297 RepID=UPI0039B6CFA1